MKALIIAAVLFFSCALAAQITTTVKRAPAAPPIPVVIRAPCFEAQIAALETVLKTAAPLERITAAAEIADLKLAREIAPAGQVAEKKIAGRCFYRVTENQALLFERLGAGVRETADLLVLKAMCCTCAAPGPCRMEGVCAGIKC